MGCCESNKSQSADSKMLQKHVEDNKSTESAEQKWKHDADVTLDTTIINQRINAKTKENRTPNQRHINDNKSAAQSEQKQKHDVDIDLLLDAVIINQTTAKTKQIHDIDADWKKTEALINQRMAKQAKEPQYDVKQIILLDKVNHSRLLRLCFVDWTKGILGLRNDNTLEINYIRFYGMSGILTSQQIQIIASCPNSQNKQHLYENDISKPWTVVHKPPFGSQIGWILFDANNYEITQIEVGFIEGTICCRNIIILHSDTLSSYKPMQKMIKYSCKKGTEASDIQASRSLIMSEYQLNQQVMIYLGQINPQSMLKQKISRIMSDNMSSEPQKEIKRHFDRVDKDGDGKLNEDDLKNLLLDMDFAPINAQKQAKMMLDAADINGDGVIDFAEFKQLWQRKLLSQHKVYRDRVFGIFDDNQDGYIDANELHNILGGNKEEINKIMQQVDEQKQNKISRIQFHKILQEKDIAEPLGYEWQSINAPINDNSDVNVEDENAMDVSSEMEIIETFPKDIEKNTQQYLYQNNKSLWKTKHFPDRTTIQYNKIGLDFYIIFDVEDCNIDTLEIRFGPNYSSFVRIYTSNNDESDHDINKWELIKIGRNINYKADCTNKFFLKSKHERYIKIMMDSNMEWIEIERLKWCGIKNQEKRDDEKRDDEITDKIKIYQCSSEMVGYDVSNILVSNQNSWSLHSNQMNQYVTFDCGKYEINGVKLKFVNREKCEIVKLRMSEVANAYSFKGKSIKMWHLQKKQFKEIYLSLIDENIYQHGFKRYLQFLFEKYDTKKSKIKQIRFFGRLSEKTDNNSEQFDLLLDEEKYQEKDVKNYKPKIIQYSATISDSSVDDIFIKNGNQFYTKKCKYWMPLKGTTKPMLIIDLFKNEVDKVLIKMHGEYPCKMIQILTANTINEDWDILYEDSKELSHLLNGKMYDLKEKHQRFLKFYFIGTYFDDTFGLSDLLFYGNSQFLHSHKETITMKQIDTKNMHYVDDDLIEAYRTQKIDEILKQASMLQIEMHDIKQKYHQQEEKRIEALKNKNDIKAMTVVAMMNNSLPMLWKDTDYILKYKQSKRLEELLIAHNTEINTKLEKTKFEEIELLQIANEQKSIISKYWDQIDCIKDKSYENAVFGINKAFKQIVEEKKSELNNVQQNINKYAPLYEKWKESILRHPKTLSTDYNIMEYESMINNYALKSEQIEETKLLWMKLADLLDESLTKQREMMHKYHLFQLSLHYNLARDDMYRNENQKAIYLLFDCGDREIHSVNFDLGNCGHGFPEKIEIFTADELIEQKYDFQVDENEIDLNYNNFTKIAEKTNVEYIVSDQLKATKRLQGYWNGMIRLNSANKKFVRIKFSFFDDDKDGIIIIRRLRFYVHSNNENEMDEDFMVSKFENNEIQLDRYKLPLIDCSMNKNIKQIGKDLEMAYHLDLENNFSFRKYSKNTEKYYLKFDCEEDKLQKLEIKLEAVTIGQLVISTTNDGTNWTELYRKQCTNELLMINIENRNYRWLKIECIGTDNMIISKLKFIKNLNVKNLSKKCIQILHKYCTEGQEHYEIENIFINSETTLANTSENKSLMMNFMKNNYYQNKTGKKKSNREILEERIRDEICCALNKFRNGGKMDSTTKHFIKYLLCYANPKHYDEILNTAKRIMHILSKPLIEEYKKLQNNNSPILTLKLDEKKYGLQSNITSNHGLLEKHCYDWYTYRKALFYPKDLKYLSEQWIENGLKIKNEEKEFAQIRRNGIVENNKNVSFTSCDEVAIEFVNFIANTLDENFQQMMKNLFKENREKLNLKYPITYTGHNDLGHLPGPIKTKSRQQIKVKLDYFDRPNPKIMSVLDIVRCAIVCETDHELCSLFQLICDKFCGKILRVKNAFNDVNKGTYGYRAILINVAFPTGNNQYEMITEIQLILQKYFHVRKNMHLGYGIVRSEEGGGKADKRQSYYVLAQDSCKYGKLDI
eukprot:247056_1